MPPKRKAATPEPQYEIDGIIRERTIRGKKEYLVHWLNYSDAHNEWVPAANMNCEDLLEQFLEKQKTNDKGAVFYQPKEEETKSESSTPPPTPKKSMKNKDQELYEKVRAKQNETKSSNQGVRTPVTPKGSNADARKSRADQSPTTSSRKSNASNSTSSLKRISRSKDGVRAKKSISPTSTINSSSNITNTTSIEREDTSPELDTPMEEDYDDIDPVFEICDVEDNPFKKNYQPKDISFVVLMGKKRFAAITFMDMRNPVLVDFDIAKEYDDMINKLNLAMITAPCYKMIAPGEQDSGEESD